MPNGHDALPLPDYDHVLTGHLPARIAPLDEQQVGELLQYEQQHAQRLPVLTVLERRLEELRGGASPSGTVSTGRPETMSGAPGGSKVSPTTSGPPMNPPSQGVPTNPAQPR
ncbi:hypothetical protein C5B96_05820 [Subtercola sp. Z020]|uniref:hypothetical protein n=1 Tax=Subtercola sp. Z020 TaxID=2080582 RepID=UPI000CE81C52|nr:hypothetical protein [Subtercola sp. Z020]PPF85584.1 hypothetical protein C5B96_05820 [Subtercola sp. Z020]